jgi:hypothetical protein
VEGVVLVYLVVIEMVANKMRLFSKKPAGGVSFRVYPVKCRGWDIPGARASARFNVEITADSRPNRPGRYSDVEAA